jgi:uncharacterized phage protein gp47/JayE
MTGSNLETYTFDYLMARALTRVSDTLDKRQGSIIYDALAPAVQELALAYVEIKNTRTDMSSADCTGDALTELAHQVGVNRYLATKAKRKGTFNVAVSVGDRFGIEGIVYAVLSNISNYDYILECETAGEIGNQYIGSLTPISYVSGLETATLSDVLYYGTDEEKDDPLRTRYQQKIANPPQDGNISQYKTWASDYGKIGASKILPLWNGGNSVKIVITNTVYEPAADTLIAEFQEYMDPGSAGLGEGQAPIGSKVTVVTGTTKSLDIVGQVVLAEGYTTPEGAQTAVTEYLRSITFDKSAVSYIRVANSLLNCASIEDVVSLTINGASTDVSLGSTEIPMISNFSLTEVV